MTAKCRIKPLLNGKVGVITRPKGRGFLCPSIGFFTFFAPYS